MISYFRNILPAIGVAILLLAGTGAVAMEYGTADQAKDLVAKAAEFYKANGKEKLLEQINDPHGDFIAHDLYVVAYALDGTRLAHPYNKDFIGKSVADAVDTDGKRYGEEEMTVVKTKGTGWIDYKFPDPVTKKPVLKSFYVLKVDNQIFLGCGVYKR